jgi:hypothetical protein
MRRRFIYPENVPGVLDVIDQAGNPMSRFIV